MEAAAITAPAGALDPVEADAQVRHPAVVVVATIFTFGLYSIWWWYGANRDMATIGRARGVRDLGDKPGLSALAFAGGVFTVFVSTAITIVTTGLRVQRTQRLAGQAPMNLWLYLALTVVTLGLGGMYYVQQQLNAAVAAHLGLSEDEVRERLRAKSTGGSGSSHDRSGSSSWDGGGGGFSSFD